MVWYETTSVSGQQSGDDETHAATLSPGLWVARWYLVGGSGWLLRGRYSPEKDGGAGTTGCVEGGGEEGDAILSLTERDGDETAGLDGDKLAALCGDVGATPLSTGYRARWSCWRWAGTVTRV